MSGTAPRPASRRDLLRLPDNVVGEILAGEIVKSPQPAVPYAWAATVLGHTLRPPFSSARGGPGSWWILHKPELELGTDLLVPDLAAWRHERLPDAPTGHSFTLVPDWVCEVVSPTTATLDRGKRAVYARQGVAFLWMVYPMEQLLEAFCLVGTEWSHTGTYEREGVVRILPFEAVRFDLGRIWGSTE